MRLTPLFLLFACLVLIVGCRGSETQTPGNTQQQPSAQQATTGTTPSPAVHSSPTVPSSQPPVATSNAPLAEPNAVEVKPKTDPCALLTSKEAQSIQGEPIKETKLSARSEGGFIVSQCFFSLPTFTKSISLSVTQKGEGSGARDPREFWRANFGGEAKREREKEREGGKKEAPPLKVKGIGEDAYWMGGSIGGALYILKRNSFIRISIGGAGDEASKIETSKALAQKILVRL